jgi:hypothetical protein
MEPANKDEIDAWNKKKIEDFRLQKKELESKREEFV